MRAARVPPLNIASGRASRNFKRDFPRWGKSSGAARNTPRQDPRNRGIINKNMRVNPIGIIHTPFKNKEETPTQNYKSKAIGKAEIYKKYQKGLKDIEGFSHLILIYKFHKSKGFKLLVTPFLDTQLRGLFATRYPRRPNQIGITVVKLLSRKNNILNVKGIDVIDKAPLLDVKPYIPEFAATTKVKVGWLKGKLKR